MYTYQVCLVNSRYLYETIDKVGASDRVYLRSSPSQLTLSARDNS